MFYSDSFSASPRFGDILVNLSTVFPKINSILNTADYSITIIPFIHHVVLTPCCSIEETEMLITPLERIPSKMASNEYFKEDFLRVNNYVLPQNKFPRQTWEKFSPEERDSQISAGPDYTFYEYFIYQGREDFDSYPIRGIQTQHYCINFKHAFRIKSDSIKRDKSCQDINRIKALELSDDTRELLKQKISYFYSRPSTDD